MDDASPTARALVALELIQSSPGISGARLGSRLGVSDRAARRYVAILREAGIPIESTPGRDGGYRVGRGFRLPPLMFSTAEALGLVMAVLNGGHRAADAGDPVGSALSKIIRVLPAPVGQPADALRRVRSRASDEESTSPDPETTAALVQCSVLQRRVRIRYRTRPDRERIMDVDPWGVVLRRGRWYLLCWSRTVDARRVYRVDRVASVDILPERFDPPAELDPAEVVEEHLAEGWRYGVEVIVDAPLAQVTNWVGRHLGSLEEIDADHTRLRGTTEDPAWYAAHLLGIEAPFHIIRPLEMREAAAVLGVRLRHAGEPTA